MLRGVGRCQKMPKLLPRSHLAQSFVSTFLGPKSALPRGAKTTKFSHRMHQRQTDQCELITRRSQTLAQRLVFAGTKKSFTWVWKDKLPIKKASCSQIGKYFFGLLI